MSAPPIRAAIFDLDGTLVDSYAAIRDSLNHARRAHGRPPLSIEEVRRRVGHGLESLIAELVGEHLVEEGVRLFRTRYAEVFSEKTLALDGAQESLRRLNEAGIRIAVASNKPARFSAPILESLGLASAVSAVHGPDTVGATKPDPAMLHRCLADLGAPAEQAVYIGDMTLDVESGRRAGVEVLLVLGGSSDPLELAGTGRPVFAGLPQVADEILRRA